MLNSKNNKMKNEYKCEDVMREVYKLEMDFYDVDPKLGSFTRDEVVFGSVNNRELTGTFYLPKSTQEKPYPSVIYIHGGGWQYGSNKQFKRHAAFMTTKGFAGLCINYRVSGEAKYPGAIQDSKCAVRWLRANSKRYNLNSNRIGAVGGSAGGHIAALLATTPHIKELEGSGGFNEFPSSIQVAVIFNGEFDLPRWWQYGKCNEFMVNFFGRKYEDDPKLYRFASPINHVNKNTPPILLLHGEKDISVPVKQSIDFYEKLRSEDSYCELDIIPEVGHAWFNKDPHFGPCLKKMMSFLVRHLSI